MFVFPHTLLLPSKCTHTHIRLCYGDWSPTYISGEFYQFFHLYCQWLPVASQYVVVVLSHPDKTRPPLCAQCVAFHHCVVPTINPPRYIGNELCVSTLVGSLASIGVAPTAMTSICVFFFSFQFLKAFVLMPALSHPLSSPLPLASLHSDSNPPCQLCC